MSNSEQTVETHSMNIARNTICLANKFLKLLLLLMMCRAEPILLPFFHLFFFLAILFLTYFSQYFAHNLVIFPIINCFSPAFEHA